jgi:hypothetical protein
MRVRCIDNIGGANLTRGKVYEVEREQDGLYMLKNDDRNNGAQGWFKTRFEIVKENEDMKKSDLKTGMVVEYRNGKRRMVLLNSTLASADLIGKDGHNSLSCYKEDLTNTHRERKETDIVKVYETNFAFELKEFINEGTVTQMDLIWERKDNTEEVKKLKEDISKIEGTLKEMKNRLAGMEV